MWCRACSRETETEKCELCGTVTEPDIPLEIYWCENCKAPIIKFATDIDKDICPSCKQTTSYLCTDLRPVFPEERLLLEVLTGKPLAYMDKSVWASNNRYYIDGKPLTVSLKAYKNQTVTDIQRQLEQFSQQNSSVFFEDNIKTFVSINRLRLRFIIDEAHTFIKQTVKPYPRECLVISFSGGKDSTVTADLTIKALGDPSLVHIFGNTTLEFPLTVEYAERYRKANPKAIFKTAINREQDFFNMCEDIGPPARMLRWCCSMFKTGPITRVLNSMYCDKDILTFYGIRKCESVARSKYNRVEDNAESVKIQKQKVASSIFLWKDIDIWLYIFGEEIDFNAAYRLGYDRVGCWCCPNNNERAQFLSQIYMPDQYKKWHNFLVNFAKRIGKPDPEEYINSGKWKARQGGNGLEAAQDVKIRYTNCTTEDNAKVYQLNKPIDDSFISLFVPFGRIAPELGRKLINETIVVDMKTNTPILSIQPFAQEGYEYSVKVKTMNVARHDDLQRMVSYQIRKYNACRRCLKCESLCRFGAISIIGGVYQINLQKCQRCKMCVTAKYLDGGCTMGKYLRTKG
ncbi:PUA-PAPS reductase like fusion [Dehalobacter sp. UNSWDHB]|jgi:3''-phosphoadenosine 5''-phosphosulfate sulfotransferase (PAPS reductase)/FAD synthetase and related enzymes|uniref:phosphoadenosine phosphosulfate reductase domain-containing protein n=1 Tax=unclassified Dehalobacter TaxID=2635733 RepID=UPI00028B773C|nr:MULTISPECIES: phosphoadenosine phosphosulfate reductase family protein [unclassified Dehalobacter]AFV03485.1 PUA-PAPS reductase like fusion [Dehalobacter sp. DCA]AFV06471.1 PUA-PAPS reductase like fusion [Dehalobacter sp. CF]EQB22363.1 PUA-PAPS reductase like fusion [Dehalobacter sp. UNSWDHB]